MTSTSISPTFRHSIPPTPSPQCRGTWCTSRAARCVVLSGGDCDCVLYLLCLCCDCVLCLCAASRATRCVVLTGALLFVCCVQIGATGARGPRRALQVGRPPGALHGALRGKVEFSRVCTGLTPLNKNLQKIYCLPGSGCAARFPVVESTKADQLGAIAQHGE